MGTTQFSGSRVSPGSLPFDRLDAATQATISALQAGSKRVHDVAGVQTDATLDPGASPSTGVRYILLNTASLHAHFGTITGVGNGDIVEWDGAKFVVSVNISAETQTLQVWNDGDKHYWIGDPESASAMKWAQGPGLGSVPFDPTTSQVPNDKVTVQDALAWLADAASVSVHAVDYLVADRADVAGFTAGAMQDGHAISAGQVLLVSDLSGPDFLAKYTVQASGASVVTGMLGGNICLIKVGMSLPAAPAGLYVYTGELGDIRQVLDVDADALQHLDPVFGDRLSVAAALARAGNLIVDSMMYAAAYADLSHFTAGATIGGRVVAAGDRIAVVDFGGGSAHSGAVYTVQASGAPVMTTARPVGRTIFIVWAPGYGVSNYPAGMYVCGPGPSGYESYRLSQNSTDGLVHADPVLGLVTVMAKFDAQDAAIAAAAASSPAMQYAVEAADGSQMVFTMPFTVTAASKIYADGMILRAGAAYDYTYSGAVVTLNAAAPAPVSWVGGMER